MLLPSKIKTWYVALLRPIAALCLKTRIHPHALTAAGFFIILLSANAFRAGSFRLASVLLMVGGAFDTLDGWIARVSGTKSLFGALFDSVLDRYSEIAVFLGLCLFYMSKGDHLTVLVILFALAGSVMVSYVRARAEGLGEECSVGWMQRTERIVCLAVGGLLGGLVSDLFMKAALWIIAVLANFTAVHRVYYIWRRSKELRAGARNSP